ncbi:MAG: pyridoxal phosphate-dependent aminotransferase [Pseudomonadota bacterium]
MASNPRRPRLSRTAEGLLGSEGDDGWGLFHRARSMAASGRKVINLAVGEHDRRADDEVVAALVMAAESGPHGYGSITGRPSLRAAVAERLSRHGGPAIAPEGVHITMGCQAALLLAMQLVLDPDDECLLIDPYYATYPQTVRAAGARPVVVPADPRAGFQPDPAAVDAAIGPNTRALLLNTPNNPTGAVYSYACLTAVAEVARARGLWLISDEVYDGLVHRGAHVSPRSLPGMADQVLLAGSLSKSYAMTGWRVGWLAGPPEVIARAADFAVASTYGVPPFLQSAAEVALREGAAIEASIAAETAVRGEALIAALPEDGSVHALPPDGAMYAMLDVREAGQPARVVAERLLDEYGIATMPGESFGAAAEGHLRLALVAPAEEMARVAKAVTMTVRALRQGR